jgi:hypothetical protein
MDRLRSYIFVALIGVNWGTLILMSIPLLCVAYITDQFLVKIRWQYSILIAQDHYVHAIMGGHHLTTISSMLGHLQLNGSTTGDIAAKFVNWLFKTAINQDDHCLVSMEESDIFTFSARRAILGSLIYYSSVYWSFQLVTYLLR